MMRLEDRDWLDTLQSTAQDACKQCGEENVKRYLQEHFGVSSIEELAPSDYDKALDDLDLMASD